MITLEKTKKDFIVREEKAITVYSKKYYECTGDLFENGTLTISCKGKNVATYTN